MSTDQMSGEEEEEVEKMTYAARTNTNDETMWRMEIFGHLTKSLSHTQTQTFSHSCTFNHF